MPQKLRLLAACAAVVLTSGPARAVTVRVRGASRIEARAVPHPDGIEVEGRLVDDAGKPIDDSRVTVSLDHGGRTGTPLLAATACPASPTPVTRGEEYVVRTNAVGRFCLRIPRGDLARRVRLQFGGDRFHDPSSIEQLPVDAFRRSLELQFFPEPRYLALDKAIHDLWVKVRVRPPGPLGDPLRLQLLHATRGTEPEVVDTAVAHSDERVRFSLPSTKLGGPGPGTLTVRFAGTTSVQSARHDVVVETTTRVELSLAGLSTPGDPRRGMEIPVAVGSSRGAVPSGIVEALASGVPVGNAPVQAGAARVVARFDPGRADRVPVTLRYHASDPWWLAGEPLETDLELVHPGPWRRWPWALTALAVVLWVMRSWTRPRRTERGSSEHLEEVPTGRAEVVFLERGPERSGWRGVVVDAHEGVPIEGAAVRILKPTFTDSGVAVATQTNAHGRFDLEHVETPPEGCRLDVSAKWHATLTRDLPPAGSVSVSLVTRRRALLESLVEWARGLGRPWAGRKEPTPGQVARVAALRRSTAIREWAEEVERAAFGPEAVDETRETAVRAREPQGPSTEHT